MRRSAIERLLPAVYQRAAVPGSVLTACLDTMETLHAPTEDLLDAVEDLFAAYRSPDGLVPFLLRWVALDHILARPRDGGAAGTDAPLPMPLARLRDLLARGAELAQWRGTATGLRAFLETATGATGFAVEEPADRPFHVVVRVPPAAMHQLALVRRIVAAEKPAAVTCEVVPIREEISQS